jgi:hypothetical protein
MLHRRVTQLTRRQENPPSTEISRRTHRSRPAVQNLSRHSPDYGWVVGQDRLLGRFQLGEASTAGAATLAKQPVGWAETRKRAASPASRRTSPIVVCHLRPQRRSCWRGDARNRAISVRISRNMGTGRSLSSARAKRGPWPAWSRTRSMRADRISSRCRQRVRFSRHCCSARRCA